MSPWLSVVLFGVAVFGFSWLMPKRGQGEHNSGIVGEAAYDRLLEDLEMENRELVDAVAKFKEEQDQTVQRLGNRIVEMERQMKVWTERTMPAAVPAGAQSAEPVSAAESPLAPVRIEEAPVQIAAAPTAQPDTEETVPAPASIRVRYANLIAMHDKGRSVDHIAKTAGMNKGEVQLILQLARREEEQLA